MLNTPKNSAAQGCSPDTPAQGCSPDTPAQGCSPDTPAQDCLPETPAQGCLPETPAQGCLPDTPAQGCKHCEQRAPLGFDFTMAFQPIVDSKQRSVFGYEALARGRKGEGAGYVLARVNDSNRYAFDQSCRVKAITLAAQLGLDSILSINFLCNAVYRPELCIRTTLAAAEETGFPTSRIMFEFTESERMSDCAHTKGIIECYRETGFKTGIDDFGAGYSGLNLLADFMPDIVKIDMGMVRGVDEDRRRQIIIKNCVQMLRELGIVPLAEGIETRAEMLCIRELGIDLMQGYYFAKPGFETLPPIDIACFD